jgi:hypothetical protein
MLDDAAWCLLHLSCVCALRSSVGHLIIEYPASYNARSPHNAGKSDHSDRPASYMTNNAEWRWAVRMFCLSWPPRSICPENKTRRKIGYYRWHSPLRRIDLNQCAAVAGAAPGNPPQCDGFKLRWRDYGNLPPVIRPRCELALIYPDAA